MKKILVTVLFLGALMCPAITQAQTVTSGRVPIYRAAHTKMTELIHTKLKVNFDYQNQTMGGEEWLTARPYFYPTDSLVLNAKVMLIHEVALDQDGKRTPLKYDYANNMLKIFLDKTYNRDQQYTVYINYTSQPEKVPKGGSAAITDDKGLYFINPLGTDKDKPTQIWTQGETQSNSVWFPTIDKPNQKTTQEIYMTVPDKYVTLSNGLLVDSKKEGNGLRTDHWVLDKPNATYLFFMGVGDYAIVKDHWKNIPVNYYIEKPYEPYAMQIYGHTPAMIDFFSKYLNYDYAWPKYDQIDGRDYVSGAMENTTATLHSSAILQKPGQLIDENTWESTIAHELFHHWFGDLVTTKSWANITVNESMADYSEYLWFEHEYGKDWADFNLMQDNQRYLNDPANFAKDLVRFDYKNREDVFDLVAYQKGGAILNMLRNYLGDDAFRAGLHDYLVTHQFGNGTATDLRLAWEKASGRDLNWFFNQWYYSNGNPKLNYTSSYDPVKKEVSVTINQTQTPLFQFPLAIDVYDNGKPVRQNVWVNARTSNTFTFPSSKNPDLINVNADGVLLAEIAESKTPEQYLLQYKGSKELMSRYAALKDAGKNAATNNAALQTLVLGLKDPFFKARIEAIKGLDLSVKAESKAALKTVEELATKDPKTMVQGAAIGALGKTKDKKYESLYLKGLDAVSDAVRANSLTALAAIDPAVVAQNAGKIDLKNVSEDLLTTMLPIIVKYKITSQMDNLAPIVAFYPFVKFQNPQLGQEAEDGFNWIMDTDNTAATESITKMLGLAKGQVANNPQAKMMIVQMLQGAVAKKAELLKQNPNSQSIPQQIKLLNDTIASFK